MDSAKIKLGVIGAGKMGSLHLEKFLRLPQVQVLGFFDTNGENGKQIEAKCGVRHYATQEELLFELDAVVIAAPTRAHYPIARLALQSGLHVFIEKPLADRLTEAEELVRLAREQRRVLQVGFLERTRYLALAKGFKRSPVRFIEAQRFSSSLGRDESVDVVTDLMIHDLDLAVSLVGEEPSYLSAIGGPVLTPLCDVANVHLEFPSGAIANISASRVSPRSQRKFHVFSADSYSSMDFVNNTAEVFVRGPSGQLESSRAEVPGFDALQDQAKRFIDAVLGAAPPLATGEDGLRALRLADQVLAKIDQRASWKFSGGREAAPEKNTAVPTA